MTPTLEQTVRVPEATVFREVSGEAVLLQLERGMYYGLDPVGTRLWQLLVQHGRLSRVLDAGLEEFDVEREELARDLLELVEQLEARGLLTLD